MYNLFIGLALFASVMLVLVVLAQNSKGGGLSNQFGGSGASNLIGVKKTGDLLERLTWAFAISIMVFTLATSFTNQTNAQATDDLIEKAKEQQAAPLTPGLNLKKPAPAAPSTSKKPGTK
jgi:preprotein translocase subunit SecG